MALFDYFVNLVITIVLIVGVYQFYFLTQKRPIRQPITYHSKIDEAIPFMPQWSWVYSFLYYPAILYLNLIVKDHRQFLMVAMSFIVLLALQMIFFWLYPVHTPAHWRTFNTGQTISEKFLRWVQYFDAPGNCMPSMHVSVAMLTAGHALATLGAWVWLFPLLIALSCLFTKQHYLIDLPAGAMLGYSVYWFYTVALG